MRVLHWLAVLTMLFVGAAQGRDLKLTTIELDSDDLACGLRIFSIEDTIKHSVAVMKARLAAQSDYEMLVAIATIKRPADCASDVIVTVRRPVELAGSEKFRTRDGKAFLELCRHGGIVVAALKDHERDFLKQVERSVMVCLGQLAF